MATSSIFATVRIDSPEIAKDFLDSYDKHMCASKYLSKSSTNHIVTDQKSLKKLFEKKFPSIK